MSKRQAPHKRRSRIDRITTGWMIVAIAVAGVSMMTKNVLPQPWWTVIHIGTLGVISNGILQWSWYFSRSLLRLQPDNRHAGREQIVRQILFTVALIGLIGAMWHASVVGTVIASTAVGAVIAWHGAALIVVSRSRLASRFAIVIRYYMAAAVFLVVGCVYAGLITVAMFADNAPSWILEYRDNLTVAHSLVNALGWIGLSISGTLVTLGPTILRTRMEPGSVGRAMSVLPYLVVTLLGMTAVASLGAMRLVAVTIVAYAGALAWGIAIPLLRTALRKSPAGYAAWNVSAGLLWIIIGLGAFAIQALVAEDAGAFRSGNHLTIAAIGVGGILQIFIGSLTYLMPVVVGGGPSAVRAGIRVLETGGVFRVTLRNVALILALLMSTVSVAPLWWIVVIATFLADIGACAAAGMRQARAKRGMAAIALPLTPINPGEEESS